MEWSTELDLIERTCCEDESLFTVLSSFSSLDREQKTILGAVKAGYVVVVAIDGNAVERILSSSEIKQKFAYPASWEERTNIIVRGTEKGAKYFWNGET